MKVSIQNISYCFLNCLRSVCYLNIASYEFRDTKNKIVLYQLIQLRVLTSLAAEPQPFMVLYIYIFVCGPQGYGVHSINNFRNCAQKILRRFFANFCHEIGCENDQTYIFRFVTYLSTFFYTYLPINIHFQFISLFLYYFISFSLF